jgi:gamma-glutamyltranspeptidase / glutathione hydrolase
VGRRTMHGAVIRVAHPSRAAARSTRGIVATPHAAASSIGLEVLRRGGTAVDAAVAANAVLAVVYPASCGLGGDALAMVYEPDDGTVRCYNGSGRASRALNGAALREQGMRAMPLRGALTVTVPGAVRAWYDLLVAHGRMDLDELLAPAEGYAREGFVVTDVVASYIALNEELLRADAAASALLLARGVPRAGDVLRNVALADTLRAVREGGPAAFYEGAAAAAIVRAVNAGGNPMTLEDCAAARTEVVDPARVRWNGRDVLAHPPNSQGALAPMVLGALERDGGAPPGQWCHLAIEALKFGFDVRDAQFADPAAMRVEIDALLAPSALRAMRAAIDPESARERVAAPDSGGTIAIVAVDQDGRAVSLIESLFMGFGSGLVADGAGVFLHNRGAYFSLVDGHPNELAGATRPLHTLSPGMILRDGRPELVYGTMGGDGQVQTHVQLAHNVYDLGMDVQVAIDQPRFVYGRDSETAFADLVRVESRMPAAVVEDLRRRGHAVEVLPEYDRALGHASAISVDRERGTLEGGSDPRADSAALGL